MTQFIDPVQLWAAATEELKRRVQQLSFWRGLEAAKPICIEDDTLVLGFGTAAYHLSAPLLSAENRHITEHVLSEIIGRSFAFKVIEGDTLQDWENHKKREEAARQAREAALQKQLESRPEESWDTLSEQINRKFLAYPNRAMPHYKARFMHEMLQWISEVHERLAPGGQALSEPSERALARALERVASCVEATPALVAYEYLRLRGEI